METINELVEGYTKSRSTGVKRVYDAPGNYVVIEDMKGNLTKIAKDEAVSSERYRVPSSNGAFASPEVAIEFGAACRAFTGRQEDDDEVIVETARTAMHDANVRKLTYREKLLITRVAIDDPEEYVRMFSSKELATIVLQDILDIGFN